MGLSVHFCKCLQNIEIYTDIVSRVQESTFKFSHNSAPRYIFMKRILFLTRIITMGFRLLRK